MIGWRETLRISLPGPIRGLASSIQGWQVFRRLIVDDLCMFEDGLLHDGWLQREEMREAHEQPDGNQMVGAGLEESIPRKVSLDEHVRPESGRGRAQFEEFFFARRNQIAKVDQKSLPPRRQFDQQSWNLR